MVKDEHVAVAGDSKPAVPRTRKLTPELQKLVDREEEILDQLYEGNSVDTVDTGYRYSAYAARIRTLLLSAHRYVAYTSDIGESFRPVAHPWLVKGAYGVSWAYIFGDVANEGYKAYLRNQEILAPKSEAFRKATETIAAGDVDLKSSADRKALEEHFINKAALKDVEETLTSTACPKHPMPWKDPEEDTLVPWPTKKIPLSEDYRSVMAERAVFQSIASMGLPAFTIHSIVKYSGRAMKNMKSVFFRTWAPIGLGLSVVPALPYLFDKPVEEAVQWAFHNAFLMFGGPNAVPHDTLPQGAFLEAFHAAQAVKKQRQEERERRREERRLRREKSE
ncbi:hypothetical protein H109_02165 [Trichophyton interdigitale MR816]|uniref:Mitochondrial fission process protein 1 n=1 Tax=Trichophyton interdigitale (strain MR816) TaxID=1215338 RepID=A0A059JDR4_TRIIM|nr:hypothetical protein H101_02391 [Trichophyton interdigitale H6]KDB26031.1 hypothetical protein H109_02165 [Trichophyton interdigitale MR816]